MTVGWLGVVLMMSPVVVLLAVARNEARRREMRSATVELRVDEFGARRVLADGREEVVEWGELTEVEVVTAQRGPHGRYGGVVVLAGDSARGCLVPLDRIEDTGLVEQLQLLPGFDSQRLIEALGRKAPSRSTVWERAT
ncbi:hypothetical protein [Rhabdothermincola sediminis]|uniref:hypothetical protein n=1 Tax=Rhabdothermincola sediminis TaxID=2751370 RepID=UPI001AA04DA0|nr:hypothetical protein [Rhabdothermincola sediminis]